MTTVPTLIVIERTFGNLGFKTYVVSDATFAFARTDFEGRARTPDEVHAMSLASLQGEYATVIPSAEALELSSGDSHV